MAIDRPGIVLEILGDDSLRIETDLSATGDGLSAPVEKASKDRSTGGQDESISSGPADGVNVSDSGGKIL